ncbi:MAG: TlpA disulfide reductase family protein [Marmoricola sp.]
MPLRARSALSRLAIALLAAVLLATLAGCGGEGTGGKGYVDGKGVINQAPPGKRVRIGKVSGTTLTGKHLDLSDYRGKVLVVNVWGSWCPPCRAEAPTLAAVARRLKSKDVVFVGIDTRDSSRSQGLAFKRQYHVDYPSIYDPDGRSLLAFRGAIAPDSIPSTMVVDRHGRVAASILGQVTSGSTLADLVHDARKSPA